MSDGMIREYVKNKSPGLAPRPGCSPSPVTRIDSPSEIPAGIATDFFCRFSIPNPCNVSTAVPVRHLARGNQRKDVELVRFKNRSLRFVTLLCRDMRSTPSSCFLLYPPEPSHSVHESFLYNLISFSTPKPLL